VTCDLSVCFCSGVDLEARPDPKVLADAQAEIRGRVTPREEKGSDPIQDYGIKTTPQGGEGVTTGSLPPKYCGERCVPPLVPNFGGSPKCAGARKCSVFRAMIDNDRKDLPGGFGNLR